MDPTNFGEALSLHKVAVIGTGFLGIRIAGELAICGCTVRVHDYNPINMQTVHSRIAEQLEELKQGGLLPHDYQLPGTVIVESVLSSAVTDADIIIEAVKEDRDIKNALFRDISSVCSREAILCTNSLNLSLADVFEGVPSPERTLGLRFLYPVHFINSVEVTPHDSTADTNTRRVTSFLLRLGKSTFSREPGVAPLKLTVGQAMQLQTENAHNTFKDISK